MGFGTSILLFAIGAILVWGVSAEVRGVDVDAIGMILMFIGVLAAMVFVIFMDSVPWRRRDDLDRL